MTDFFVVAPDSDPRFMRAAIVRATGVVFDGRFEKMLLRGDAQPPSDLSCVVTSGVEEPDLLSNTRRIVVTTSRVADALRAIGARGVEFFPVSVLTPDGARRRYEGLVVRGRAELHAEGGAAHMELQTGLHVRAGLGSGGYLVDEDKWDRSDVFITPDAPMTPIWSERAADVLQGLGPIGVAIIPAQTFNP